MTDVAQPTPEVLLAEAQANVRRLELENQLLREMIRRFRLEKFGRPSEKLTDAQLALLEEEPSVQPQEVAREAQLPAEQKQAVERQAAPAQPRQPHPGRTELPAHLPRVIVNLPCTPEQCHCGQCGKPTVVIGYDEHEELDLKPAEYFVRVVRQEKRVCKDHPEQGVATAAQAPRIREKGKLADEFIIEVLLRKYHWHQPLYRQAAILEQEHRIGLNRQTLGDAVMWVGALLEPVRQALRQELLSGQYIQADETPVGVQSERVRGKNFTAFIFEYSRPHGPAVYDFQMGRGREGPQKFLEGYAGILQCDGYAGYDKVGAEGLRRAGCLAHMRRRFWNARELAQNDGDLLKVVGTVGELYAVEAQARQQQLDAAGRLALRQAKSVVLMESLKTKIVEIRQRVLPKSTAGDACSYALNQWERLMAFLQDGRIEIDNNWCENGIRPIALGRKNWLHIGSEGAGPRVAAIISVMETCRRLKIDVRAYLRDVLPKLPDWPINRVAELTPMAWQARHCQ
jgi:transposase